MSFTLRPYQSRLVESGVDFITSRKKKDRKLIVAPTAAGKSIIISEIVKASNKKMLVLQPSKELLEQNVRKYQAYGESPAVYSASAGKKEIGTVTYATIGSIVKVPNYFEGYTLMIDEAHLYPPNMDSMFGKFRVDSGIEKVLGLTATPYRLKSFNGITGKYSQLNLLTRMRPRNFSDFLEIVQIQEMTSGRYWAPFKYRAAKFKGKNLVVNSTGADYTERSMSTALAENETMARLVKGLKYGRDVEGLRHQLAFVPLVEDAKWVAERVEGCGYIHGGMNKRDRENVLKRYLSGELNAMVNVNVLSVGFDFPKIDHIILARPTMSLALYYQQVGRGARLDPENLNKVCTITDLVGMTKKFGKVEDLRIANHPTFGWCVIGSDGKPLTNVPMY